MKPKLKSGLVLEIPQPDSVSLQEHIPFTNKKLFGLFNRNRLWNFQLDGVIPVSFFGRKNMH